MIHKKDKKRGQEEQEKRQQEIFKYEWNIRCISNVYMETKQVFRLSNANTKTRKYINFKLTHFLELLNQPLSIQVLFVQVHLPHSMMAAAMGLKALTR